MNYKKLLICCFAILFFQSIKAQELPVGHWRNHISYGEVGGLCDAGDVVYVLTESSFYAWDKKTSTRRTYDKTDGLCDWQARALGYSTSSKKLIIAYDNSKLDILDADDHVTNVFDIYNKDLSTSKTIHSIYVKNNLGYICTDYGISVYDVDELEFGDTYVVGSGGVYESVTDMVEYQGKFYIACSTGIKEANSSSNVLYDYHQWTLHSAAVHNVPSGACRYVATYGDKLYGVFGDKIYQYDGIQWTLFFNTSGAVINSLQNAPQGIVSTHTYYTAGVIVSHYAIAFDIASGTSDTLPNTQVYNSVDALIDTDGNIFIAGKNDLFYQKNGGAFSRSSAGGFRHSSTNQIIDHDGTMYLAPSPPSNTYNTQGFSYYKDGTWTQISNDRLDYTTELNCIDVRNSDQAVMIGSYRNGLIKYKDNTATVYNKTNSPIRQHIGDTMIQFISGVLCDESNNTWIINSGVSSPLILLKPDGSFQQFTPDFGVTGNLYSTVTIDNYKTLWIRTLTASNIALYNPNTDLNSSADDYWELIGTNRGLPASRVLSLALDKDEEMWVGTETGVYRFRCLNNMFLDCKAEAIQTSLGGFGSPTLFYNVAVNAIAVDGANRKWIGTNSGVYLISADGQEQLRYFSAANSPLLSDAVNSISINPETGEVFFLSSGGISSYRSDAIQGEENNDEAIVFPNPVSQDYRGPITISHIYENSLIKITDQSGALVHENVANGGMYSWTGKDYLGRDVVSGIYNIHIASTDSKESRVLKVVIIR